MSRSRSPLIRVLLLISLLDFFTASPTAAQPTAAQPTTAAPTTAAPTAAQPTTAAPTTAAPTTAAPTTAAPTTAAPTTAQAATTVASEAETEAATSAPPAPDPSVFGWTESRIIGWTFFLSGAALSLAGVISLAVGLDDFQHIAQAPDGTTHASVEEAESRAPLLTGLGIGMLSIGLISAIVGTWVLTFSERGRAWATLTVHPSYLTLRW